MSKQDSEAQGAPAIAMVATSSARLPEAASVVSACKQNRWGLARLMGALTGKSKGEAVYEWNDQNLVFPYRDAQVALGLMPAPIPWSELEGPCATSRWPEATKMMKRHTNHLMVAVLGGSMDPIERRLILTKLVSAVIPLCDTVGIYWGDATLVHSPDEFVSLAESARSNSIPGPLWLDVRVELNADKSYRCFTTGMKPLGFLEIEVQSSNLEPEELASFIGDTACYVVDTRQHIPDGNTMGRSATEQYIVRHAPSMFDRQTVMQLVMQ